MSLLSTLLLAAPAPLVAQELSPQEASAPAPQESSAPAASLSEDLMAIYIAHVDHLLKHPKDQGLKRVADLLGARLLDLPGEIPDLREVPPQLIPMAYDMLRSAKTIRITDARETSPFLPVNALIAMRPNNPESAGQWLNMVEGLMRQGGAPIGTRDTDGWLPLEGLPVPVRFGAPDGSLQLLLGEQPAGPADYSGVELPGGIQPGFAMQMDLGLVMEMFMPLLSMEEPELAQFITDVASATGLDEFSFRMACGSDDRTGYMVTRMPGLGAKMRARGLLPVEGLTADDLRLIPADATVATLSSTDLQALFNMMLGLVEPLMAQEGFDRPLERIEEMVGIHLERDLMDHLGTHVGSYMSDTTGGGGLFSTVVFVEVKDRAKLDASLQRLAGLLNGAVAEGTQGYVQMRTLDRGGVRCHTLTFPGLPIPLELTLAMGTNNLFVTLTPQAAVAAVQQEAGLTPGLGSQADFVAGFDGNFTNLYGLSYYSKEAFLKDGYGVTSLLCSALSNGVRSRQDLQRDAGLVMPTYKELIDGVRPTISLTRLEADGDVVTRMESDPSMIVGVTRTVGSIVSNPAIAILAGAGFLGAMEANNMRVIEMPAQSW